MSKPVELTRAEWALMQCLWQRGRASATELQKLLESQQGWAYSTVKTMLDRMVDKGAVSAQRDGNVYEYSPRLRRQSAIGRVVDDMFDRVLEGSLSPLVSRLIESRKLSAADVAELRAMLDRYDDEDPE
jgi:BlaI family penicillinase repressor